jgi:ribonuclease HII
MPRKFLKPGIELDLFDQGFTRIIGIDEVGRGAWAGPLVIGAFVYTHKSKIFEGIDDSKKLTKPQREKLFQTLSNYSLIHEIGVEEIDSFGVGKALENGILDIIEELDKPDIHFLIDGRFPKIDKKKNVTVIEKGDSNTYSVAAASIVAKVFRDRLMTEIEKEFPGYGFEKHVGYGTKLHSDALDKYGVCKIHRLSYKPVQNRLKVKGK